MLGYWVDFAATECVCRVYLFETTDYGGKLMFTSEQLDALQAAAEAATPGPWLTGLARFEYDHNETHYVAPKAGARNICQVYSELAPHDAAFIAAANPAVILELVTAHRAALARIARVESLHREKHGEKAIYARGSEPGLDVPTHFEPYVICQADGTQWPCATKRALTEGEPDAVGQTS